MWTTSIRSRTGQNELPKPRGSLNGNRKNTLRRVGSAAEERTAGVRQARAPRPPLPRLLCHSSGCPSQGEGRCPCGFSPQTQEGAGTAESSSGHRPRLLQTPPFQDGPQRVRVFTKSQRAVALCRESQESQPGIGEEPPPSLLECWGNTRSASLSPGAGWGRLAASHEQGWSQVCLGRGCIITPGSFSSPLLTLPAARAPLRPLVPDLGRRVGHLQELGAQGRLSTGQSIYPLEPEGGKARPWAGPARFVLR